MELPRLRLLGYQPTRPCLRLVQLPELVIEPSPVPLNSDPHALDHCVRREGWIAFEGRDLWGIPIPLEGDAFRIAKWTAACIPSRNGQAIWTNPNGLDRSGPRWERAPSAYVEYDGVAREVVDEVTFPARARLVAEIPAGLIVHERTGEWSLWRRGASTGEPLDLHKMGPPGTYWPELDEQPIFFDNRGKPVRLSSRLPGQVGFGQSFSPDGRYAAIDLDMSEPDPFPEADEFEVVEEIVQYTAQPHRLALIDCATGDVRIAWGVFDNFATDPIWSHDGQWLVFHAPFIRNKLWVCHIAAARLESISFGRRSPPVPRANITDLVSD